MFTEFDRLAMTRALALAERGLETTHPNPRVGCVIAKGDRIIGEGWHERAGEAHAEVAAIRAAKEPVAGATAYVTLEPCSHHGRTPPCVNALIDARIARVVFAVQDPNPRVSGQGADALLRAGITVEAGLMQAEATELNIGFMKRMREGLPWVRVKLAMSLDGRTALANGQSQWITSEPARNDVQRWRARCSAVMTGVGTVLADDPQLNVRVAGYKGRQPLRVVLDARLRSPVGAKMFVGLGAGGAGVAAGFAVASTGGAAISARSAGGTDGAAAGSASARAGGAEAAATGLAAARAGGAEAAAAGLAAARAGGGEGAAAGSVAARAAGSAVGAAPASPRVGGVTGAGSVAGAVSGTASVAAAPLAGDVLIFTAIGGGVSAASPARSGSAAGTAALADDMAELVNAFETSPTAVAARSADLAGPVSVKTEAPSAAAPASGASAGVQGASTRAAGAGAAMAAAGATVSAPGGATAGGAGGGTAGAAVGAAGRAAAGAGAAVSSVPPTLAAAAAVSGVPTSADDATWAGAALSGAIPVGADAKAAPTGNGLATDGRPSANTGTGVTAPMDAALPGGTASAGNPLPLSPKSPVAGASAAAGSAGVAAPAGAASLGDTKGATSASAGAAPRSGGGGASKAAPKADTPAAFQARRAALLARGVRIEEVVADDGFLDLFAVLKKLAELEVNEVLVEAGPTLAGQLLTTFFVDELLLYIAPKLLGPQGRPLVNLPELQSLQDAWGFALFDAKRFGDDLRLRMRPK